MYVTGVWSATPQRCGYCVCSAPQPSLSSQRKTSVAAAAARELGQDEARRVRGMMPEKVSVRLRAMVTAGWRRRSTR